MVWEVNQMRQSENDSQNCQKPVIAVDIMAIANGYFSSQKDDNCGYHGTSCSIGPVMVAWTCQIKHTWSWVRRYGRMIPRWHWCRVIQVVSTIATRQCNRSGRALTLISCPRYSSVVVKQWQLIGHPCVCVCGTFSVRWFHSYLIYTLSRIHPKVAWRDNEHLMNRILEWCFNLLP